MTHELEEQRLRAAFAALAEIAGDGSRCPVPGQLWASAREELSSTEAEEVVLHLGECMACATAWRLARELLTEGRQAPAAAPAERRPLRRLWRWTPLAAAAVLIAGVAGVLIARLPRTFDEPAYRSREARWLEARLPARTPLSRAAFVLRWAEGPSGTTYDVHVTTEKLEPLTQASGLKRAEYTVEEAGLAKVASGERVLWRVIAHLPDGRIVASRTFVTALE